MFQKGAILTGPQWNEPVEMIEMIEEIGIGYLIKATGLKTQMFYEHYLMTEDLGQIQVANSQEKSRGNQEVGDFIRYHFLKDDLSSSKVKPYSQVIPLPHQIEAVYSRMLQTPTVRYLLADDPGAGKTIMSGMVISEMLARGSVNRILILVPPLVLKQWQEELKGKFGEDFTIVNRELLQASSGNPFLEHDKILCSLYWGMRDDIKAELLNADYDLVIIDEAHKLAAYTEKEKKKRRTKLYRLGEALSEKAEHLILLTATPHKGDRENYRHLMSLLDEDMFQDSVSGTMLHELAKPFVIRRLKESMVQFDGTPLFPKRTTTTIAFKLSELELSLYDAVTDFVRSHFDRAKKSGNRHISFAMMILQRRLSSSLEAIYNSLINRRQKLLDLSQSTNFELLEEDFEAWDEVAEDEIIEVTEYDPYELEIELNELNRLIQLAEAVKKQDREEKYLALEATLFGHDGLLATGEKLLIFTESKDTLRFLKHKIQERIGEVVQIEGSMNMQQRQQAVARFKNEVPVLIATDAGGESINLQFCNQMVNYDIPWNPNRLEQRMGRIHRIGQKNEVFVFNLVASNTREGQVMTRLFDKLDTMRQDLGTELVYDFLGEVLQDHALNLNGLMMEAIQNRERLDLVIETMDKILSSEHMELIELAKREQTADVVDLPGARQNFNDSKLTALPIRAYSHFLRHELERHRMKPTERERNIFRLHYIPATIHKKIRELGIKLNKDSDLTFTTNPELANEEVQLIKKSHPLLQVLMNQADETALTAPRTSYETTLSTPEALEVIIMKYGLRDGNNRLITTELRIIARRSNQELTEISQHWLFSDLNANFTEQPFDTNPLEIAAKKYILQEQQQTKDALKAHGTQKQARLISAFDIRLSNLKAKLLEFADGNDDNRNQANINKYTTMIRDQEQRKQERLQQVARESVCNLQRLEVITTLKTEAHYSNLRYFPTDIQDIIQVHEQTHGRTAHIQKALGLVDFYSEDKDGNHRYILAMRQLSTKIPNREDYDQIASDCWIYLVEAGRVMAELRLEEFG